MLYSADDKARMVAAWRETGSIRRAAAITGTSFGAVKRAILHAEPTPDPLPIGNAEPEPAGPTRFTTEGDSAKVEYVSDEEIRTEEDAIRHGKFDMSVWYIHRMQCTAWQVVLKVREGKDETPVRKQLWRVSLDLRRIMARPFMAASQAIFDRMAAHAPAYPTHAIHARSGMPYLATFDLCDAHFGKYAWGRESGENGDLRTAEQYYRNAVDDLLAMAGGFNVGRIVMPIGNDFFHVDSASNTTTAGTPVDTDGRYAKIIETGEAAVIAAIERLAAVAPVTVMYVPGNHDKLASLHLTRTLRAWFRNCDRVTVDVEPTLRKRIHYGKNLIGFTHGNEEKHAALPMILVNTWPHEYAASVRREWHCGHIHRERRLMTTPVDTVDAVSIRFLHALSSTDAWHYQRGYVGNLKAADALFYAEDGSRMAQFSANARL